MTHRKFVLDLTCVLRMNLRITHSNLVKLHGERWAGRVLGLASVG